MTKEIAIRILTGDLVGTNEELHEAVSMAVSALEMLIWIPCSERLPEVGQRVMVTLRDGTMGFRRCIDAGHLQWFYANTIAWRPAPEPYQGDKHDSTGVL